MKKFRLKNNIRLKQKSIMYRDIDNMLYQAEVLTQNFIWDSLKNAVPAIYPFTGKHIREQINV